MHRVDRKPGRVAPLLFTAVGLALAMGCRPPAQSAAAATAGRPTSAGADDSAAPAGSAPVAPTAREAAALKHFPDLPRVQLARRTPPRWTPAGEPLPSRAPGAWPRGRADLPLVERRGDAVRVAHVAGAVALMVWVDAALAPVLTRPVRLHPTAAAASRTEAFIELAPGAELQLGERRGGRVHVAVAERFEDLRLPDGAAAIAGWIPAAALGERYHEQRFAFDMARWDAAIRPGAWLHAAPGGRRLMGLSVPDASTVASDFSYHGRWLERRGGWVRVELTDWCPGLVRVTGWVEAAAARRIEPPALGGGCATAQRGDEPSLDAAAELPRSPLAEGLLLRARPGGPLVGRVLRDTELPTTSDGRIAVPTIWGPLWVYP